MMDKNREEFETWFDDEFGKSTTPEEIVVRDLARQAWQASRQAIDFQLPDPKIYLCQGSAEAAILDIAGHLTSLGIRVKGNEE